MNFLGILGEAPNHQLHDRDVIILCTWNRKISAPLPYAAGRSYQANIVYDYNGSGFHFQNNDPRYILPLGSKNLALNRIELLKQDSEIFFWRIRQIFIIKTILNFLSNKQLTKWAKKQ